MLPRQSELETQAGIGAQSRTGIAHPLLRLPPASLAIAFADRCMTALLCRAVGGARESLSRTTGRFVSTLCTVLTLWAANAQAEAGGETPEFRVRLLLLLVTGRKP